MVREQLESKAAGACAIREAAMELFALAGFDAVSLTEIASRANVCKANIFHHFDSKEALYLAVVQDACRAHAELSEALLDDPASSVEKLRRLVAFDFAQMQREPLRIRLIFREFLNIGGGQGRRLAEQVFRRNMVAVQALVRQGQERGEFRTELDPGAAAWVLGSATVMYFQNRELLPDLPGLEQLGTGPEAYADAVLKLLLNGMLAAPAVRPAKRSKR